MSAERFATAGMVGYADYGKLVSTEVSIGKNFDCSEAECCCGTIAESGPGESVSLSGKTAGSADALGYVYHPCVTA